MEAFLRDSGTSAAVEIRRLLAVDLEAILGVGGLTARDVGALRRRLL